MPHISTHSPAPGARIVSHVGDRISFVLEVGDAGVGEAFLRTTAGCLLERRRAVIANVEQDGHLREIGWHDVPMKHTGGGRFEVELAAEEVGVIEARGFFLPAGCETPVWPAAQGNVQVKVEPAWTRGNLGIYGAFVRLFGGPEAPEQAPEGALAPLDRAGFTVIPPSGTLRQLGGKLDHIFCDLGFSVLLLLPPFPTPTTWARMGRFGSPFAPLDFYTIDPALAEFDRKTTPLDQFRELIDGVHARGGRLFIDVPINHTGWASRMLALHPEWFEREESGEFKSPGAWGVTWADLVEMHYDDRTLWQEMAAVFLHWCREGVDGFRCDAGYMIPTPVWEYITAKVREEFPDTVFLLEGLGGPIPKMIELLAAGGLDWAYSELFQNYDRGAVQHYLPQAIHQSESAGLQVNFAETHDNNRLAAHGTPWAKMRTALAALTAPNGAWGLTCGVEWLAKEKIAVHGRSSLNWGAAENQLAEIRALNRLLAAHPAFQGGAKLQVITQGSEPTLALLRTTTAGDFALVLVNLDPAAPTTVRWKTGDVPLGSGTFTPLLRTGGTATGTVEVFSEAAQQRMSLDAGEVVCLGTPEPQQMAAKAPPAPEMPPTSWQWPRDRRREVVWAEGTDLAISAPVRFEAWLEAGGKVCHCGRAEKNGAQWQVIVPETGVSAGWVNLRFFVHESGGTVRTTHRVFRAAGLPPVRLATGRKDRDACAILTNRRGAMCQVRGAWGTVQTQYDSLLAANLHPAHPVDRRMLLGRVRGWVVRRGYSAELSAEVLESFAVSPPREALWKFSLPVGDGFFVDLTARLVLAEMENRIAIEFTRGDDAAGEISLILRPDIEDRGFHEKSFFSTGVNALAPESTAGGGFVARRLHSGGWLRMDLHGGPLADAAPGSAGISGIWHDEPEIAGVGHPIDAERGLGGGSELFSPGWFGLRLHPKQTAVFRAGVTDAPQVEPEFPVPPPAPFRDSVPLAEAARTSLRQFIVKRDDSLTVIAGYPWFLDWGRDTLICLRGIIAAGWLEEAREILKTFAAFEKHGTLPNMIRGADDSNRDTVDAPLWFFVATQDLLTAEGSEAFLHETAGGRTILQVLRSIAEHYASGTPNGIRMDPASGLVFSPSHYTWMDTNHPAGTPRQGYPISAQAKWHLALRLLARIDTPETARWTALADQVRASVQRLFVRPENWLSDCLHAAPGQLAATALADDHLRPNQLLAVTLGLVDHPELQRGIVAACGELVVPGALRTLADRPVTVPLRIERQGWVLNDPHHPFWPAYTGDEDTRRKPAYHNGTAWPWLLPMHAEALLQIHGPAAKPTAAALLGSAAPPFNAGALGHLAEIMDGGAPHTPRGCPAQAWSVSELVRVLALLDQP